MSDIRNPDGSLMNRDQIVFDLFSKLSNDDKKYLSGLSEDDVRGMHHGWGMGIRNAYGLWKEDSPVTGNWMKHPETHDVRDGTDYSADHPDQVSNDIMVEVWKKIREIAS